MLRGGGRERSHNKPLVSTNCIDSSVALQNERGKPKLILLKTEDQCTLPRMANPHSHYASKSETRELT